MRRLLQILIGLVALVVFLGGLNYFLLHIKRLAVEAAISELVTRQTEGQYDLTIARSTVDLIHLSFTFEDIAVTRNDNALRTGIREADIPKLTIRLRSIKDLFQTNQINIKSFSVVEPSLIIDSKPGKREKSPLAHQLVTLFPAVESILNRFQIESFLVERARFGIIKDNMASLKLKLIDLLVEKWNRQTATVDDSTQLVMRIGKQKLNLKKATVDFSEIRYDLKTRLLTLRDFRYASFDTVSQTRIELSGKKIELDQLGYLDLVQHNRLTYQKAILEKPTLRLQLHVKERKDTRYNEGEMITQALKSAIGECYIDSLILDKADVHAVLMHQDDSIVVDLPQLDFKLHRFGVIGDSSYFQFGQTRITSNNASILLKNGYKMDFREIYFDRYRDLSVSNFRVRDPVGRALFDCRKLQVSSFFLLNFILTKELSIGAIRIEDANLAIGALHAGKLGGTAAVKKLRISEVTLKNLNVNMDRSSESIAARGLSIHITKIQMEESGKISYVLHGVALQSAEMHSKTENLGVTVHDLAFDNSVIRVGTLDFNQDSIRMAVKELKGVLTNAGDGTLTDINYNQWRSLSLGSMRLEGRLTSKIKDSTQVTKPLQEFSVDSLVIGDLGVKLAIHSNRLSFSGSGFLIETVRSDKDGFHHGLINGKLAAVNWKSVALLATVRRASIRADRLQMDSVRIQGPMRLDIPQVIAAGWQEASGDWKVDKLIAKGLVLDNKGMDIRTDSIRVNDLRYEKGSPPTVKYVEVFGPTLQLRAPSEDAKQKPFHISGLDSAIIYPGQLFFANGKELEFGRVDASLKTRAIQVASLHWTMPKSTLNVNGVHLTQGNVHIDSMALLPIDAWYAANPMEYSVAKVWFYGTQVDGIHIDENFVPGPLKGLVVTVDKVKLEVKRDKRLLDPPFVHKPATLAGLFKLPKDVQLNSLSVKDGDIHLIEISGQTGLQGEVEITKLSALAEFSKEPDSNELMKVTANGSLYSSGRIDLTYKTLDTASFELHAVMRDFDLAYLNRMLVPLQSLKIKSGYLLNYDMNIVGNDEEAVGSASISYKKLHLQINKKTDPEKKSLLSLVADGVVLKHNKKNATSEIRQPRVKDKSTFHLWVRSAIKGAMGTIKRGKGKRKGN